MTDTQQQLADRLKHYADVIFGISIYGRDGSVSELQSLCDQAARKIEAPIIDRLRKAITGK